MLVEAAGQKAGRCRSCGRPIVWAQLARGPWHPFDPPLMILAEQDTLFDTPARQIVDTTKSPSHYTTCTAAGRREFGGRGR
jgi:hypothetical protein